MKKTQVSFVRIAVLVILLLLAVSLCSCHRIAVALLQSAVQDTPAQGNTANDQTNLGENQTSNSDLHQENPETIITQSDTQATEHGSAGDDVFAISDVVKKVQDSVVQIYTSSGSYYGSTSAGSGVIVDAEKGYILTCNHVVSGATRIIVELSDNTRYDATEVGTDATTDLAVLQITPKQSRPLTEATQGKSAGLIVGEIVVAIGNPLGTLGGSVTQGIISATERQIQISNDDGTSTVMTLLQTDAAINGGNSGGGLFNLKGDLVGIVNAKYARAGVEGLGFAIPIDTALPIELDLIRDGYVHGRVDDGLELGYRYYNIYGMFQQQVEGIYVNSSKFTNQLREGDRILSINGVTVNTLESYKTELEKCKIGDVITISYSRNNVTETVQITLREYKPEGK